MLGRMGVAASRCRDNPGVALERLLASLRPGGRDFERLCKWLLENAPEYRRRVTRVWLWDEWPGRWGRDAGIDLVAEDHEGGLWAIQAKHYDPAYAIKKADLDSFLSESSRSGFTYRLVIASTDHVGPTARRTLDAQEKPVGLLLRSQLELLEADWPASATRLRPGKVKRKRPRPHQRRAIRDCARSLAATDRGQLVMACGTGKTLIGPFLSERMSAKRVLVLLPSLSLLGQTLREWATATEFDYIAVCSDETVAKDEHDAVVASTSELGIPVTTDVERIARFLRRRGNETRVVFSTYQSSAQIAAAQASRAPAFDLVIADEAHRCAGPQAGVFATVLDPKRIKARKRLFMTATPRYFTGRVKKEAQEADWEVASMDDEERFGPVLHRLTFAHAIEQGLLSDYQVVVVGVSDREARTLAERGAFVSADGESVTDARTLAREIGLLRSMAKYDLRRIVTFHSRVSFARRFASSLPQTTQWLPARRRPSGTLWAQHVSGEMTAGERDLRLRQLRAVTGDERGVLANARCLTEGVDVPTLDGVAFIDPRRSQVDVVQAVGRAIRKAEDKLHGTIVIPVLVTADDDPEQVLESSEFDRVWEVVRALRNHDDDLAEELDALRRERGRRGSVKGRPGKIALDLPVRIGVAFARAFDAKVVERTTSRWDEAIGAASAYREVHGDLRVEQSFVTSEGFALGSWIAARRWQNARGELAPERVAALDALGMIWEPHQDTWRRAITAALEYRSQHGHLRVPNRYVTEDGLRLGDWISGRRTDRNRGTLSAERVSALDQIGMEWDARQANWEDGISAARAYRDTHGHLDVPPSFVTAHGFRLGSWIGVRRWRRRQGTLSDDRIRALDALGMTWEPYESDWERGAQAAQAYREAHGNLRIPTGYVTPDGLGLGSWISNQRTQRKAGKLSTERIAILDGLGMVWGVRDMSWEQGISAARSYVAEHGNLDVPINGVTDAGFPLGRWLFSRRQDRRLGNRGSLSQERIDALDALGMNWTPRENLWKRGLAAARAYRGEHGDLRVPYSYVTKDGFTLGIWISERRAERDKAGLPSERIAALDALGMVWDVLADRWRAALDSARAYRAANGDLRVPAKFVTEDGFALGAWISGQRQDRNRGKLLPERTAALDALGMIWNIDEDDWQEGLALARAYRDAHGDLAVPQSFVTDDGFKLGRWIANRRTRRRRGVLSAHRIEELDALGMVWDAREPRKQHKGSSRSPAKRR
jgi:superfamily II DNA or RNA helicase